MDKIKSAPVFGGTLPSQVEGSEQHETKTSTTVPSKENNPSNEKCLAQEARTREKESGLQASIRKQDLLTQAQKGGVKSEAMQCVGSSPVSLKSEAEVRALIQKRLFPAVKEGMEKSGLNVNDMTCNYATGMMKNALDKQGVGGVTIKGNDKHAYLEVKTQDGQTLIVDPTIAQWTKDGTAIDKKLQKEGFVGTREDLRKLVGENIESWILIRDQNLKVAPEVLDAARGKSVPKISQADAKQAIQWFIEIAEAQSYAPEEGKGKYPQLQSVFDGQIPAEAAREQAEWYEKEDLEKPLNLRAWQKGIDRAPQLRQAYQTMEEALRKSE